MKIKISTPKQVGAVAVAVTVLTGIAGGVFYTYQNVLSNAKFKEAKKADAATSNSKIAYTANGKLDISNTADLAKLNYNYRVTTSTTTGKEDLNVIYVLDDSGSRSDIIDRSVQGITTFKNSLPGNSSLWAISYIGATHSRYANQIKNSSTDDYRNVADNPGLTHAQPIDFANSVKALFDKMEAKNPGRKKVLVFESDFMDMAPQNRSDRMTPLVMFGLGAEGVYKQNNIKVLGIDDVNNNEPSVSFRAVEDGWFYRVTSTDANNNFIDRNGILDTFVSTFTTTKKSSTNTQYKLSLAGTNYKFSKAFLDKVKADTNFRWTVSGEDTIIADIQAMKTQDGVGQTITTQGGNANVENIEKALSFMGVGIEYRSASVKPAAVEYLTVTKDAATDRIAINFNQIASVPQTVFEGDKIEIKDSFAEFEKLKTAGITTEFATDVSKLKAGDQTVKINVTQNGLQYQIDAKIKVLPKITGEEITVFVGDKVEVEKLVHKDYDKIKGEFSLSVAVDLTKISEKAGDKTVDIIVTHDETRKSYEIKGIVHVIEKPLAPNTGVEKEVSPIGTFLMFAVGGMLTITTFAVLVLKKIGKRVKF